jgi:hypothetical protein
MLMRRLSLSLVPVAVHCDDVDNEQGLRRQQTKEQRGEDSG